MIILEIIIKNIIIRVIIDIMEDDNDHGRDIDENNRQAQVLMSASQDMIGARTIIFLTTTDNRIINRITAL